MLMHKYFDKNKIPITWDTFARCLIITLTKKLLNDWDLLQIDFLKFLSFIFVFCFFTATTNVNVYIITQKMKRDKICRNNCRNNIIQRDLKISFTSLARQQKLIYRLKPKLPYIFILTKKNTPSSSALFYFEFFEIYS